MADINKTKKQLLYELGQARQRISILESMLPEAISKEKAQEGRIGERSGEYLRSVVRTIPDLVWLKDPDGIYLACNAAFESFFGAKECEIVGKTDHDFVSKELADFFLEHDRKAMEAGKSSINEEWLTFAGTGKSGLFETIKTPMLDPNGNVIGILGVSRDVTERKNVSTALEERLAALTKPLDDSGEVTFENLFNIKDIQQLQDEFALATGVASIITRPDGTPITKPSNFCRLCNDIIRKTEKGLRNCYKSDAVLGKLKKDGPTIQPCMSGGLWDAGAGISVGGRHVANWLIGQVRDESQTEEKIRAYAREIGAQEEDMALAFSEVKSMPLEQFERISRVLFTIANKISSIAYQNLQQARYINALKLAESELATTRNYLSNIIDSMPSVLIGVDTGCKITQWNVKASKTTRQDSHEVLGKRIDEVLPRLSCELERIEEAMRTRTAISDSLQTVVNGGKIYEDIVIYPLVANGINGAVMLINDVTDRIRLEQMMVQSEKMASVGGLAAGMAHEINNPLSSILQAAQVCLMQVNPESASNKNVAETCGCTMEAVHCYLEERRVLKFLDGIHEAGKRAAGIVSSMLEFSRKSELHRAPTNIHDILDKSVKLAATDYDLKKKYDFRHITIERYYEPGLPLINCNRTEIEQVILNLLKNAAQAIAGQSQHEKVPTISLRTRRTASAVRIEVSDNGPGMTEAVRRRVFEPFFTTKEVGEGTGLGLSVAYFIVTSNHDGSISVESEPGKGATFIVELPLSEGGGGVPG
ncbi:signal transduction histidine kinase, nitrogen specific, NtrB [Solidesulfovibrio fructosivorans JJ]]|uniref:histidine kinase n=1 Tax=Solidesulfovibrio fructosivorans JJ] TaxID=596151 RepID=E1JWY1_SOLFR|nr:PocR ligand-binding domain-containing protein [Solidesulfovibrio fructosivorans]EFL51185.1 signal transduction histidine kinase, nitrogen specific, NtrB [Solidesulfovibrio fructosivorans JJ]]